MRTFIFAILALLSLALTACSPQQPSKPNTVVYGSPFQPNSLNPLNAPDIVSRSAIEVIFDGLVAVDDKSQLRPELATSWESSDGGKTLTFHLRKGVKWHDGKDFTAEDVKFTYDSVIAPDTKSTVSKADYAGLQKTEVVDPLTVRFTLAKPNAPIVSRFTLGIVPRHLLEGQDLATTSFNQKPVGTGPFVFESWTQGESLVVKRNPGYFGTVPKIEKLVWKVVPDSNVLALQASNGEVDVAPIFSPKDAQAIKSAGRMALSETMEGNTQISLQLKNPLFQDVRVRRALAYGIDNQALIDKIMGGAAVPATSDILPTSWAYNPDVARYSYDPARAKALLAEAGWKAGPDGILAKDGKRFEMSLMTDAGNKPREQVMLAVRQYWADLDIDVKAGVQERNSFVSQKVLKGDFDAVLLQSSVQSDPDISRRFHTNSIKAGQNFLNYSNPEADKQMDEGLTTLDQTKRTASYFQLQKILADDLPQISLFYTKTLYASKVTLQGVKPAPTNLLWNAEEWEWK